MPSIVLISLSCLVMVSCNSKSVKNGMLLVAEAPKNIQTPDYTSGESWRYLEGARICAFIPGKHSSLKVLTDNFYSAFSPEISYDGRFILFTAQQKQDESWQIWEMNLDNLVCRKVTSFNDNCTDPAYLPGGRLVFSKLTVNDTVKSAHCLYTCNLDGSGLRQISFSPDACFATTVLKDGRLLTIRRQMIPETGDPLLMVMRPDGTKADMFYKSGAGEILTSSARETSDGKILFIEADKRNPAAGRLISINYNRPLHTRIDMTSGIAGDFCSVLPLETDRYLVSYRKSDLEQCSLYEFDPVKKSVGQEVIADPGYNILDAVLVERHERPKELPSEVDLQVKTGLLLCQNINFFKTPGQNNLSDTIKAVKIEVLGVDTTYGMVQVEEDGSFQLKVMADKPFRIRTLDECGNAVSGPCTWLWLRPNERRGCVGCHEDPEIVPENRVPFAVKKAPVMIPVHITEVKEKIIELE
jgi:Hydrazine synthase alpha subunit middle domain